MKTHAPSFPLHLTLCLSKVKASILSLNCLLSTVLLLGLQCQPVQAELPSNDSTSDALALKSAPNLKPNFELHPHKAIYSAKIKKGLSIKGEATRELKRQGEHWLYRFDVDSIAANIKEQVLLDWHEGHVRPLNYDYSLSGFFIKTRKRQARFDWAQNSATGKRNKDKWQLTLDGGELERLGYQLQLGADFAQNKPQVDYRIVHKGRIENSQFKLLGEETIDTVLGTVASRVVKKIRAADKKRETLLWFSIDQPLLLLKMTQKEKDGEEYEVQLKQLVYYDATPSKTDRSQPSKPQYNQ